ncbi:MAG: hypothetical protein IJ996_05270 [Clostridia bacterium]|nr:hypothetical protein [Clostridia bacterium]
MSKMDAMVERIQEQMYWERHERLNGELAYRLQTRTREQNVRGLFSVTALAVPTVERTGEVLQSV